MILLKKLLIPLILLSFIFFVLFVYTFIYYSKNLPSIDEITEYKPKTITKIYDSNDLLYGLFFDEKREYRNIDKIPLMIKNAFISAEDKNFFKHSGYDPIGYLKALISFIKEGKLRGASTITQQVTKGFLLSGERTFERKVKELILALRLEDALSKNKILEIYLNEVYLGENSYGVVAASKTYFSKDLDELSPGEAAFLAALPKSPKQYNPKVNIFNAVNRRNFVLKEMYQNGYLDKSIKNAEIKKDLIINFNNTSNVQKNYKLLEGFIADEIRSDIQKLFGSGFISRGGLSITTSINTSMQQKSNDLLIRELTNLDIKNNKFKPPIFNSNIKDFDKNNWEYFFKENFKKKSNNIWNLGVIKKNKDGKYLLKTDKSNVLSDLNFPYEKPPVFVTGDVVYYTGNKDKKNLTYKQIPFFDGGIIVFDRKLDDILVLNGGFNYLSSNLNMITERKENFQKAMIPFLLFIMFDQNFLFEPNINLLDILNEKKKLLERIYVDSNIDNSNLIEINKKHISELGLNYLSSTKEKNHFFTETNEVIFNTQLTLYDLINYYKLLLNRKLPSENKLLKKVSDGKKILYNSKDNYYDFQNHSYKSSETIPNLLIRNKDISEVFNLKKFSVKNFDRQKKIFNFYGWNIFEKENGYNLFIGFDNSKIIGCYITLDSLDKKNSSNSLYNSCLNIVKKLF